MITKLRSFFSRFLKIIPKSWIKAVETNFKINSIEELVRNPNRIKKPIYKDGLIQRFKFLTLKIIRIVIILINH